MCYEHGLPSGLMQKGTHVLYIWSFMRVHALLNFSNELRKIDVMRALPGIILVLHNKFYRFIIIISVIFDDFESHFLM